MALLIALALGFAACRTVPYTGRKQLSLIPSGQEAALGDDAYRQYLKESKISADAQNTAMVRRVGERLARVAERPDFKWEFNLIEDKTPNAFCLPGGKVGIHTGILQYTQDEDGLAVVMGHEIAHAIASHGTERMSQGLLAQFGGVALAVALSEKPSETQTLFTQAYGLGVGVGVLLPFSRKHESEADRIGLILMSKAGYDPRAAVGFWQRMGKAAASAQKPPEFLSTHPSDERRIADIEKHLPEALSHRPAP